MKEYIKELKTYAKTINTITDIVQCISRIDDDNCTDIILKKFSKDISSFYYNIEISDIKVIIENNINELFSSIIPKLKYIILLMDTEISSELIDQYDRNRLNNIIESYEIFNLSETFRYIKYSDADIAIFKIHMFKLRDQLIEYMYTLELPKKNT